MMIIEDFAFILIFFCLNQQIVIQQNTKLETLGATKTYKMLPVFSRNG